MKKITFCLIASFCLFSFGQVAAQVYSDKVVGKKNAELADSLKNADYPYALPIWGDKATKLGFDLPYSAGLSVQYLWQESEMVINNLNVGFNNGPQYNLDEIIRFNNTTATTNGVNIRPDIWLFPFLNVYGLFAKSKSSTAVDFGIYVPDTNGVWNPIANATTKAEFDGTTLGFGLTPTIGVGGGWMALDMNCSWTDIEALEKPAFVFVFGPRFGKSFKLSKQQNIAAWVGGFRVHIKSETSGSLPLSDLGSTEGWEEKIENGYTKVENGQQQVDAWWNNLTPLQQSNPVNIAKYETANRALTAAGTVLDAASGAIDDINNSTVQYSLDKKQKDLWNFVVGSQYQLNKHWMLRLEYGFLGSREQMIVGLQYRFGL